MKLLRKVPLGLVIIVTFVLSFGNLAAQVGINQGVLNPNLLTEIELAALPNLSAAIAKEVVENRLYLRLMTFHAFLK